MTTARANYRVACIAFAILLCALVAQILVIVGYLYVSRSADEALREFGWGRVPRERFAAFLWASRHFQVITIALLITWGIACLVLIDRAARSLRILGVRQYFGPGLTVWSVFIPFYCLYRPWAGLGEVRNTLSNARRERRLPPAGIRGANSPTVFYGIAVFAYLTADKIAGRYADMVVTAPRNANEFHANISFMSNFLSFELFILAALLGATTWYWLGMIRLLKQTSMLTAPSEEVRPNAATLGKASTGTRSASAIIMTIVVTVALFIVIGLGLFAVLSGRAPR